MYSVEDEDWWDYWDLRAPSYYGRPVHDIRDLGFAMASDRRFAECAARRIRMAAEED